MSHSFFKNLPSLESFTDACDSRNFHPAPQDWFVVITDVEGSTKAILEGRYKDVNMVGAACIAAVVNTCGDEDIPFVFGGDGATFIIPPEHIEAVKKQILAVKAIAKSIHDLDLRVGIVPIQKICDAGGSFEVAKFVFPTGKALAMFNDGAILADKLLKKNKQFLIEDTEDAPPNLQGLSCRWKPIPSHHGIIMTLLVMARSQNLNDELYRNVLEVISKVSDSNADANPASSPHKSYKWPNMRTLRESMMVWRQGAVIKNLLEHIFLITLFNIMNRYNLSFKGLNVPAYRQDMITNSDYRKFDGMLRMVLDCTEDQVEMIETHLADMHGKGQIVYGTHYSNSALMTCFVQNLEKLGHVHFIDGNDGGYASAAKKLKEQLLKQVEI
ncbi:MAG: DUF3095 domain-containing protein [Alphaproteobacteria bacterium]